MALKCYTPHEAWIAGSPPLHLDKQTCGARRQEDDVNLGFDFMIRKKVDLETPPAENHCFGLWEGLRGL